MKYRNIFAGLALTAGLLGLDHASAQDITNNKFGKGVRLAAEDSSFSLKFSTRFQTLYQGHLNLENNDYNDGLLIRRARLKFEGFAYSPKVEYKIELGLSNRDMANDNVPQSGKTANIILDAVLKWNFTGNWSMWFGQTKLPGNRERVISSQALQFVDRSNLNSKFNLDRDLGVQLHYDGNMFNLAGAFSMGEGRDIVTGNAGGYDYTGRIEYLLFGPFTGKGDYFSADLRREPSPRLSIGVSYDFDNRASREAGQLGSFLTAQRNLSTIFVDAHFKYNGISSLVEFAHKSAPDGTVIEDTSGNFVDAFYTGDGFNIQAGYLFTNNFEIAGRYTVVTPEKTTLRRENKQYTLGVSRYVVGHSLKVQSDLTLINEPGRDNELMYRFQVELGL